MQRILIATHNQGKAREFEDVLAPWGIVVKTLADFVPLHIDENGVSFEENARLKARSAVTAFGLPVLADDSGLVVDALNGDPGVNSARYAGDHDDAANNIKLLEELRMVPWKQRTAHFHATIVALKPTGEMLVASGEVAGHILRTPLGKHGFGYDPLFWVDELQKSMGQLTRTEKNLVSHRGRALKELMQNFVTWWEG